MAADHSETTITYTQQYRSGLASKQQKFKDGYINRGTGRMRGIIHRFNYFQLSQGRRSEGEEGGREGEREARERRVGENGIEKRGRGRWGRTG